MRTEISQTQLVCDVQIMATALKDIFNAADSERPYVSSDFQSQAFNDVQDVITRHDRDNEEQVTYPNPWMTKEAWLKEHLKPGEVYAGLILGKGGERDYHLILMPGQIKATWDNAVKFALGLNGELPTSREQALLYANLPEEFEKRWYWSGEQPASYSSCAWFQYFDDGYQLCTPKVNEGRARAVRRIYI